MYIDVKETDLPFLAGYLYTCPASIALTINKVKPLRPSHSLVRFIGFFVFDQLLDLDQVESLFFH
jgi:hypothetical protein